MPYVEYEDSADFYITHGLYTRPMRNMHHHHSYELYYLQEGEREYFIDDRFFVVRSGDIVLVPRKVFHRTAGKGGRRILLHFSGTFLKQFFTEATLSGLMDQLPFVFRPDEQEREQVLSYLDAMLQEYTRAERKQIPLNKTLLSGYLFQLLFSIANGNNTYVPQNSTDERITEIIHYINENYNQISDIQQIADHFFISKYYLCRLFQKKLGVSLMVYLNTIKIRQACLMIKNSNANMTEVAIGCGFNSSSYFCKVFKREKGISPTEYRKKQR